MLAVGKNAFVIHRQEFFSSVNWPVQSKVLLYKVQKKAFFANFFETERKNWASQIFRYIWTYIRRVQKKDFSL